MKIYLQIIFLLAYVSCFGQIDSAKNVNGPFISFEKLLIVDSFNINEQPFDKEYEFKFTNTGNEVLLLDQQSNLDPCIFGFYPKEPIKPGQSSKIIIRCPAMSGPMTKTQNWVITSNANNQPTITVQRVAFGTRQQTSKSSCDTVVKYDRRDSSIEHGYYASNCKPKYSIEEVRKTKRRNSFTITKVKRTSFGWDQSSHMVSHSVVKERIKSKGSSRWIKTTTYTFRESGKRKLKIRRERGSVNVDP